MSQSELLNEVQEHGVMNDAKPKSDVAIANELAESTDQLRIMAQRQWREIAETRSRDDAAVAQMANAGFGIPTDSERIKIMQARWDAMQLHVDSLKAFLGDVNRWVDEIDAMAYRIQEKMVETHDRLVAEHIAALPMQRSVAPEVAKQNPIAQALWQANETIRRRRGAISEHAKNAQAMIEQVQDEMKAQSLRWRTV